MAPRDFKGALTRQLGFLARSCASFDNGFQDEAIRIAQCIRVMLYDTKNQTSILSHLNSKGIELTSTCMDMAARLTDPNSLAYGSCPQVFNGMGRFESNSDGMKYHPKLGDGMFNYGLPVEQWLDQTVFILDPDTWVTRKDVALSAADKDGGAHVDAKLTAEYERLIEGGDLGYFVGENGAQTPITDHHYVALRQMGCELLISPALLALSEGQE